MSTHGSYCSFAEVLDRLATHGNTVLTAKRLDTCRMSRTMNRGSAAGTVNDTVRHAPSLVSYLRSNTGTGLFLGLRFRFFLDLLKTFEKLCTFCTQIAACFSPKTIDARLLSVIRGFSSSMRTIRGALQVSRRRSTRAGWLAGLSLTRKARGPPLLLPCI